MQQMFKNYKEKNIKDLLENKTSLKWVDSYTTTTNIEVICKRELPTVRVIMGDKKITLHSAFEPQKEAVTWADSVGKKANAQYVVFGFGLGYHIRELRKLIDDDSTIVVIEPSYDIFYTAMELVDLSDILKDEKIIIFTLDKIKDILQKSKEILNVAVYTGASVVFTSLSPYTLLFNDIYIEYSKKMENIYKEAVVSRNTTLVFSGSWQENLLKNLGSILESNTINGLVDKFKDIPAIIVSAGPSLNKNIHLLKDLGNKAVIISTDTALKALFKNGIKPHFVISIDGSIKNYEKYSGINYNDIPLVYTPKVNWNIINNHHGKKLLFSCGDIYTEFLLNKYDIIVEGLSSGGSVANNATHFAVKMGANPVIFMGQDLAFTDNKSHAEGTMYDGKNIVDNDEKEMFVKDIYGGKVKTNYTFIIFLKWFEDFIANDKSERIYIDCTEGGAYIEGTEVLDLADCINKYMKNDFNITQRIKEFLNNEKTINSSIEFDDLINFLKSQNKVLEDISRRSHKAYNICKDIIFEYNKTIIDSKKISGYLRKIDKIDEYIKEKSDDMIMVQHTMEPVIYNAFSSTNKDARLKKYENQKEKDLDIIGYSLNLYKGINSAIEYTLPFIEECIQGLVEKK